MTATLIANPPAPGSPEWLRDISASKVAAILGLSPWQTPHALWHLMAGTTPPEPQTDAQGRGHEFEPLIRQWFADAHPSWEVAETGAWRNDERPWQTADPDGLVFIRDRADGFPNEVFAGLEIKTAADLRDWGRPGTDQVPDYYRAQAVWQMDTLELPRVIFAVCGPFELFDRRPKEYVVEYDATEAEAIRAKANAFRMSLRMGVEPPPNLYREEDRRVLRYKHPRIEPNPGIELPAEVAVPWLEALAAADLATAQEAKARADLLAYLGNGKTATYNGHTIGTRRNGKDAPVFSKTKNLDPRTVLAERKAA